MIYTHTQHYIFRIAEVVTKIIILKFNLIQPQCVPQVPEHCAGALPVQAMLIIGYNYLKFVVGDGILYHHTFLTPKFCVKKGKHVSSKLCQVRDNLEHLVSKFTYLCDVVSISSISSRYPYCLSLSIDRLDGQAGYAYKAGDSYNGLTLIP